MSSAVSDPGVFDNGGARACLIVGAGPAGVVLAWLLARRGVEVTLLERHADFERDFRGDTLHPLALGLLDDMGLIDQVLEIPHSRLESLSFHTPRRSWEVTKFEGLGCDYPFVAMLPQARFLECLVNDARRFESFDFLPEADVTELLFEDQEVVGLRYRGADKRDRELRGALVVAADGRGSRLRRLAEVEADARSSGVDLLWFRVPRQAGQQGGGYFGPGGYLIALERGELWQLGLVITKGSFSELKADGLEAFKARVASIAPGLEASVGALRSWSQVRFLAVQADCLRRWYRPGLLFLGDAAHTMSPVAGVGINYAIQDAVVAAGHLVDPLLSGSVDAAVLRRIQRARHWPTRFIQAVQAFDQRFLIEPALRRDEPRAWIPFWLRWTLAMPLLRRLPAYVFTFGLGRARLRC